MNTTDSIVTIHDLLDEWRSLGCTKNEQGIERIGQADTDTWMHTIFPGLSEPAIAATESQMSIRLPKRLRALYRCIGGMTLFQGAFQLHAPRNPALRTEAPSMTPPDLAELDAQIDALGWKPNEATAFAVNAWDGSIHLAGMGKTPAQIVRCKRTTGQIIERHHDAFDCISSRLSRLDEVTLS